MVYRIDMEPIRVLYVASPTPAGYVVPDHLPGAVIERAASLDQALERLRRRMPDAILAAGRVAPEMIAETRRRACPAAVLTWQDAEAGERDREALDAAACHVFPAPPDAAALRAALEGIVGAARPRDGGTSEEPWKALLAGESPAMREIDRKIRLVGPRRCTVLISGETGTGKEMAARAIHMAGPRGKLPMVAVNCTALPENLLEAELFGHVRGAFTGAVNSRTGRFEQAQNSTLFLDEIGDMPFELQAKLLRVLQEREFQRLGSSETVRVDVRVIAASNIDLAERVEQGRFREDLFYRLNVVPLHMPPLRDRLSDVPLLARHFVERVCRLERIPVRRIAPDAIERLCLYGWPGNVRQLENAIEMAVALSGDRETLFGGDFPLLSGPARANRSTGRRPASPVPDVLLPEEGLDFEQTITHLERSLLEQALRKTGGNKKMAASMLRLKRTTLSAKLRSLDEVA